ncbi:MAG: T9SS type A sorting domain-containing protein [Bacteroidales bacterium]|nr:T9SS type A sorting domain-containing protein [Bacteroidales bacterium]
MLNGISGEFKIDSLIYSGDSVISYFNISDQTYDFIFKPLAKAGEEWNLSSNTNRGGSCVNITLSEVFGITDSVKTFTLETAAYGNVEFILSKNFGLLQFIPFTEFFLEVPLTETEIPYYNIIGINSESAKHGFQLPGFSDYFHLSAGDILLWKHSYYDIMDYVTYYYKDSLTSSLIYNDSVTYEFFRKVHDISAQFIEVKHIINTYRKNDFEFLFLTPSNWYTSKATEYYEEIYLINNVKYLYSDTDTALVSESGTTDCSFEYFEDECNVVCLLDGYYGNDYKFSTVEGITFLGLAFNNNQELVGSKIDGFVRGSMNIPVGIRNTPSPDVRIFPNPSSNIVYILSKFQISRIEIYNSLGVLILSTKNDYEINLSGQHVGCYHLVIYTDENKQYIHKLILIE